MPASMSVPDIVRFVGAAAAIALLSACTSTESTLDPNAVRSQQTAEPAPQPAQSPAQPAVTAPPATPAPAATQASATQSATLQLASVLGAPEQAVAMLTARLARQAPANNLTLAPASGPAAFALSGFLSTSPENGKTFVYYSWDIADSSGAALHRLTGKQAATGQGVGWTAVTEADMQAVADQTLAGFSAWLATR